ncbi:MAG: GntR family transcriptional regulator [Burkholderia sp.]|jgi:GntR family transcriptional regulator|nr:GntR family transcriptional regulator [Burkholderia sp.]
MSIGTISSGNAKHAVIARALADEISVGVHPVGNILPSESDLSLRFDVSRHTVRAALRTLQELGLIASQPGVGSVVRASRYDAQYTQSFSSVEDLLQYTRTTRFETLERSEIVADADFVRAVGGQPGDRWWHLYMLRTPKENDTPVTVADIFIPYGVGLALQDFPHPDVPIFEQIEKSGAAIVEIRQEISAAMPTGKEARILAIDATQPVLVILRRYIGERGRLLEVTRTVHPADTFTYQMDVRLAPQRTT